MVGGKLAIPLGLYYKVLLLDSVIVLCLVSGVFGAGLILQFWGVLLIVPGRALHLALR